MTFDLVDATNVASPSALAHLRPITLEPLPRNVAATPIARALPGKGRGALGAATLVLVVLADCTIPGRYAAASSTAVTRAFHSSAEICDDARLIGVAPHLDQLWAEMAGYGDLKAGWDGIGSVPPSQEAIEDALRFLAALPINAVPPEATVSADGAVGWFWDTPSAMINVQFPGTGYFVYYADGNGKVAKASRATDPDRIPADLLEIIAVA